MATWDRTQTASTWTPLPTTYYPAPGLLSTHGNHGKEAYYHDKAQHYGPLVHCEPQCRTTSSTTAEWNRGSHSSRACRIMRMAIATFFIANILALLCLKVMPYITSSSSSSHQVVQRSVAPETLQAGEVEKGLSTILRKLRAAGEAEDKEQLLEPDTIVPTERWGLSPFTNWSSSAGADWQKTRNDFKASRIVFAINEPRVCDADTFILIMVTSAVGNVARRQAIRQTWGSVAKLYPRQATLVFLLGEQPFENATLTRIIKAEHEIDRDILQVNIKDSYSNLAYKSIAMLKWMDTYCKSAKHLLKADDDMYINIDKLHSELSHSVHKRYIMGEIIAGAQPIQDKHSKWYTPKTIFKQRMYPKYVSGSAYVISGDLIHSLLKATQEVQIFWLEDVYITGLCAKKVGATHVYNGKFGYKRRRLSPCLFKLVVTGHRLTIGETHKMWKALQNPHLDCTNINIRTSLG